MSKKGFKRKLTAILSADFRGYSKSFLIFQRHLPLEVIHGHQQTLD